MSTKAAHQKELFGHPVGLYVLFFTEMWERFSYYGMRGLLSLYMAAEITGANPGLGWTEAEALKLYGWYTMLVYIMSIPGGLIADKLIGQKKSVLVGAVILTLGHATLAIEQEWAFFVGLILIILGVGMLKPNISTMVGGLYGKNDIRRDKGFSIFYIGINTGSLLATTIVGLVVAKWGWHAGFGLAGIGMLLGLIVYLYGQKYLVHVGNKTPENEKKDQVDLGKLFGDLIKSTKHLVIVLILLGLSIYFGGFVMTGVDHWGYVALFVFLSFVVGMLMMIFKSLRNQIEKDRFLVVLLSFFLVIVFWGAFEQAGGLMNLYAENKTNRMLFGWQVPTIWFQSLNAGFIILFAVTVANYWAKRKLKNKEASSLFKMATGTIIMGLGFVFMVFAARDYNANGSSAMYWLVLAYFFHTIGELSSSPVSLSFVTKLAPVRYASLMMGLYFASTGLGNKVAGILGENASEYGEYTIFTGITIFTVLFGLGVIAILKPLKRLTHGAEDKEGTTNEEAEGFELADN
ncbi:peptide MFS transporter [uncultured Dokdonia sp.]|uniref:peptide MFS transporter n=1 Tax=uncultured Dokdonia sp. TaxID=575653 RepID=UPI00260B038F|nr:peptide MFS transporter [uncultured Dokdonia sp.]